MQCKWFFWYQTETCLLKICNVSGLLAVLQKYVFHNVEWVEVRKISEIFWVKLFCKMSHLFCQFLLPLRFSARKSEIERQNSKMRFWISYFLVQISFWGTVLVGFSQCNFKIFLRRPTTVANICVQPSQPPPTSLPLTHTHTYARTHTHTHKHTHTPSKSFLWLYTMVILTSNLTYKICI